MAYVQHTIDEDQYVFSKRGNRLNISYKAGFIVFSSRGQMGGTRYLSGEGFRNIKSKEAAEAILSRRNNKSVSKAVYTDSHNQTHKLRINN